MARQGGLTEGGLPQGLGVVGAGLGREVAYAPQTGGHTADADGEATRVSEYRERMQTARVARAARENSEPRDGTQEKSVDPVEPASWRGEAPDEGRTMAELPELQSRIRESLAEARAGVERWDPADQERARKWVGSASPETRQYLSDVLGRIDREVDRVRLVPFEADRDPRSLRNTFAYVYPRDEQRRVFVGPAFDRAGDTPPDSRAGVLVHEISHFEDVAATKDTAYGHEPCQRLAATDPEMAARTADNIEYFVEEYATRRKDRDAG